MGISWRSKGKGFGFHLVNALLWLWAGAKFVLDWIGRSTFPEDAEQAAGVLEKALLWLFGTPTWVPASLAAIFTFSLIFYGWKGQNPPVNQVAQNRGWRDWTATPDLVENLKKSNNEFALAKIDYFRREEKEFAERVSDAFQASGWKVQFNDTAQGPFNGNYYEGLEVKSHSRNLVELITSALNESGCPSVRGKVQKVNIQSDNPNFSAGTNKVYIRIGYE